MTGFKPRTSGVVSDRSTNWATTTAQGLDESFIPCLSTMVQLEKSLKSFDQKVFLLFFSPETFQKCLCLFSCFLFRRLFFKWFWNLFPKDSCSLETGKVLTFTNRSRLYCRTLKPTSSGHVTSDKPVLTYSKSESSLSWRTAGDEQPYRPRGKSS